MIFPWLQGLLSWEKTPLTWVLVLLNFFVFIGIPQELGDVLNGSSYNLSVSKNLALSTESLESTLRDPLFLKVHAFKYENFLKGLVVDAKQVEEPSLDFASGLLLGPLRADLMWSHSKGEDLIGDQMRWLRASLQDKKFIKNSLKLAAFYDPLLEERWQASWALFLANMQVPSDINRFGVSAQGPSFLNKITYQFVHGSFLHLLSNLVVLLIFGAALELLAGSKILVAVYLVGGLLGAYSFEFLLGTGVMPLVGASGSIAAVMGFYFAIERRRRLAFFYFFSPFHADMMGKVYLNKIWLLPFVFINDVTALLTEPLWSQSVSYVTHLGSSLSGLIIGLLMVLLFSKRLARHSTSDSDSLVNFKSK